MDKESRPAPVEREVFLNEVLPVGDCGLLILHSSSPPQRNQPLLILLLPSKEKGTGEWGLGSFSSPSVCAEAGANEQSQGLNV